MQNSISFYEKITEDPKQIRDLKYFYAGDGMRNVTSACQNQKGKKISRYM